MKYCFAGLLVLFSFQFLLLNGADITLSPVCAAIDEKGNLDILYYNNDGKIADLNDELRQLLQK